MELNPGRALQQTRSPENKVAEDAENVQICFYAWFQLADLHFDPATNVWLIRLWVRPGCTR